MYRGEHFASMHDLRDKYGWPTPNGKPITPEHAKEARLNAMARAAANGSLRVRLGGRRLVVA